MGFPILDLINVGSKILDRVLPEDKGQKAAAQLKLLELAQSGDLTEMAQQIDVNKAEALSSNVFVAGWRPFIGWICGAGLGVQFVFGPLAEWISGLFGHPLKVPTLETGTLTTLLIGMLGLGGMRTVEKLQGVQGNH